MVQWCIFPVHMLIPLNSGDMWTSMYITRNFVWIIVSVQLIRQFELSTGHVTKSLGFLTKGMTTDVSSGYTQICAVHVVLK